MNGFLVFIIILFCSIALGFLILCITGIDIVGKNRVYVVEKLGIFNKLLTTGIHFNFPLIYQIVGKYNVNIIKAQNKINDYEIEVEYKISDVKKYHYSQKEYLKEVELQFEKVDNISPEEIQNILIDKANLLGVEIINIKIFK